jgi:hypothetical protein
MQHLDNILIFVKVAEFESISEAARALDDWTLTRFLPIRCRAKMPRPR